MKLKTLTVAASIAVAVFVTSPSSARNDKAFIPDVADTTHATEVAATFFRSLFTAKSRHDVDATMKHFSREKLTYIDATLGWPFLTHDALKGVFKQYMPQWPPAALSYPTRILGNERSALVAFTDTPELFGGEIRILAAIDMRDGKVVRWVDYWDGRHFGTESAAQLRTPADRFPTDLQQGSVDSNASARIHDTANELQDSLAGSDAARAAALFAYDAAYEDITLRTQILGRVAIERYLGRALANVPFGAGSSMVHVVGGDAGGGYEWRAAPAYRATVRHGITALELDEDGRISRLTTVWDGAMVTNDRMKALVVLSLD